MGRGNRTIRDFKANPSLIQGAAAVEGFSLISETNEIPDLGSETHRSRMSSYVLIRTGKNIELRFIGHCGRCKGSLGDFKISATQKTCECPEYIPVVCSATNMKDKIAVQIDAPPSGSIAERDICIQGFTDHEILHILWSNKRTFRDFVKELEALQRKGKPREADQLKSIWNTLEDGMIEHHERFHNPDGFKFISACNFLWPRTGKEVWTVDEAQTLPKPAGYVPRDADGNKLEINANGEVVIPAGTKLSLWTKYPVSPEHQAMVALQTLCFPEHQHGQLSTKVAKAMKECQEHVDAGITGNSADCVYRAKEVHKILKKYNLLADDLTDEERQQQQQATQNSMQQAPNDMPGMSMPGGSGGGSASGGGSSMDSSGGSSAGGGGGSQGQSNDGLDDFEAKWDDEDDEEEAPKPLNGGGDEEEKKEDKKSEDKGNKSDSGSGDQKQDKKDSGSGDKGSDDSDKKDGEGSGDKDSGEKDGKKDVSGPGDKNSDEKDDSDEKDGKGSSDEDSDSDEKDDEKDGKGSGDKDSNEKDDKKDGKGSSDEDSDKKDDSDNKDGEGDQSSDSDQNSDSSSSDPVAPGGNQGATGIDSDIPLPQESVKDNTPLVDKEELEKMKKEAAQQIEEDKAKERNTLQDQVRHNKLGAKSWNLPEGNTVQSQKEIPQPNGEKKVAIEKSQGEIAAAGRDLGGRLEKLKSTAAGPRRHLPNGRLDRRKLAASQAGNRNIYYKPGFELELDMEIDVSMDLSQSTMGHREGMYRMSKMFAVAGDQTDIPTSIYGWEGFGKVGHYAMKERNSNDLSKLDSIFQLPGGGTPTAEGIAFARARLSKSKASFKLLPVITDGQPSGAGGVEKASEQVRLARSEGVSVLGFGFKGVGSEAMDNVFGAGKWVSIDRYEEAAEVVAGIVEQEAVLKMRSAKR